MSLHDLLAWSPLVTTVLGPAWLEAEQAWAIPYIEDRLPWYVQLEADLALLVAAGIHEQRLVTCYRDPLRNRQEVQKTIYEVHGAAFLASCATRVDIHVARGDGSGRNFDMLAEIEGTRICAESKTRKDEFPFNMPEIVDEEAQVPVFGGSRATMDRHDAANLGLAQAPAEPHHKATPESTVVRQILLEALAQLPEEGCNVVLFGQIEGGLINLEDALAGTEFVEVRRNVETGRYTHHWVRARNGAFNSPENAFESLSAVLWIRLWCDGDAIKKAYRGYPNPGARTALPDRVVARLKELIEHTASPDDAC